MIRVVSGEVWGKEGVYRHLELATILWVGDEEERGRDAAANVSPWLIVLKCVNNFDRVWLSGGGWNHEMETIRALETFA